MFDYLKPGATVPLTESWVYRDTLAPDCGGQPLLTGPAGEILGVQSIAPDGRERAAFTFSSNEHLLQSDLLVYGLFRWTSRGLFLGEQRHYLKLDVDDYFAKSALISADGTVTDEAFQLRAKDAYNYAQAQRALRSKYAVASGFKTTMAYNGYGADLFVLLPICWPNGGTAQLTSTSVCLRNDFEWLNHTYSHPKLNSSDYTSTYYQVRDNLTVGSWLGLTPNSQVLKTGEYSGLGVYNDDPNDDISPPTDHGLMASNPNLIRASNSLGVRYLHGNMSFPSHQPSRFNCSLQHPMSTAALNVVPDWPTNVAFFSATPEGQTAF